MTAVSARRAFALAAYEVLRRVGARATTEIVVAVERGPFGFQRTVVLERLLPGLPARERAQAIADLVAHARRTRGSPTGDGPSLRARGRRRSARRRDGARRRASLARVMLARARAAERLDMASALYVGYRVFLALAAAHAARDPVTQERAPVVTAPWSCELIVALGRSRSARRPAPWTTGGSLLRDRIARGVRRARARNTR